MSILSVEPMAWYTPSVVIITVVNLVVYCSWVTEYVHILKRRNSSTFTNIRSIPVTWLDIQHKLHSSDWHRIVKCVEEEI